MSLPARLGIAVLATALILGGLTRLRFDAEVLNLLPADLGVVKGLLWHQRYFRHSDELILTLRAPTADRAARAAEELAHLLREQKHLTDRVLWQPPWNEDPSALAELVAAAWLNATPEAIAKLADRLTPENRQVTLESALDTLASSLSPDAIGRLAYDPYGLSSFPALTGGQDGVDFTGDAFASPDGSFRVLFVRPAQNTGHYSKAAAWLQQVRDLVASRFLEADVGRDVQVAYTGRPAFVSEVALSMERDVRNSLLGTVSMVGLLFWVAHRRWRPLFWLLRMVGLIMVGALALGGWLFGALNVVSLGFAAILLGLSVDYALVLYQEARETPHRPIRELRRILAPAILWSALTTAAAFLVLNLGALPGLHQLGNLVAGGVLLAAAVILTSSPPITSPSHPASEPPRHPLGNPEGSTPIGARIGSAQRRRILSITLIVLVLVVVALIFRFPHLDHSSGALVSESSPAHGAIQELNRELNQGDDPLPILVTGLSVAEVSQRLRQAEVLLTQARDQNRIASFSLPIHLWPAPKHQAANQELTLAWSNARPELTEAALDAGFTEDALVLFNAVLDAWARAGANPELHWPSGPAAEWLLERCAVRTAEHTMALGLVRPPNAGSGASVPALLHLGQELERHQMLLTGWPLLGETVLRKVEGRLPWLIGLTATVVLVCLYAAFRRIGEIGLSLATLGLALLALMAVMGWMGWTWNLMNLPAIPLLLGVGVDYTIHVQLALRRRNGDLAGMHRTVGRALLLCAATTIAGFGSLAWASNPGLASLGRVCATGIGCLALVALGLLPGWWRWLRVPASR
jgi:uncharacterized protein